MSYECGDDVCFLYSTATVFSDVFLTLPHVSVLCQFAIKSILLCDMLPASSQLLQCALFRDASIMTVFTW